ncbi:MAG: hypothetical protein J6Z16_03295 [Candidatus Methanomethylophilaceae archaeon]|nr:hypothetical protein [Candidatus Methanomethylophilaceae archaeon]
MVFRALLPVESMLEYRSSLKPLAASMPFLMSAGHLDSKPLQILSEERVRMGSATMDTSAAPMIDV